MKCNNGKKKLTDQDDTMKLRDCGILSKLDFLSNFSGTNGKGVGALFTQQSTKAARKGAVLDAAVCGNGEAKDCGDFICV
eukprot:2699095-Ditylum_brightwellii.AAC.1